MGNQRASIKDVLTAIEAQGDSIDRLITAITAQSIAAPAAPAAVVPTVEGGETPTVKVDEAYLSHMTAKAASHAATKGEEVVLYSRKNKGGEVKLAYALRSRYDDVVAKQPSCLGAIESFTS
jgi:hypothetical protein